MRSGKVRKKSVRRKSSRKSSRRIVSKKRMSRKKSKTRRTRRSTVKKGRKRTKKRMKGGSVSKQMLEKKLGAKPGGLSHAKLSETLMTTKSKEGEIKRVLNLMYGTPWPEWVEDVFEEAKRKKKKMGKDLVASADSKAEGSEPTGGLPPKFQKYYDEKYNKMKPPEKLQEANKEAFLRKKYSKDKINLLVDNHGVDLSSIDTPVEEDMITPLMSAILGGGDDDVSVEVSKLDMVKFLVEEKGGESSLNVEAGECDATSPAKEGYTALDFAGALENKGKDIYNYLLGKGARHGSTAA